MTTEMKKVWFVDGQIIEQEIPESEIYTQEPVAWVCYGAPGKRDIDFEEADINGLPIGTNLYTTPPQRTWVSLTDEDELDWEEGGNLKDLVKAIEAKLKEKNT